MTLFDQKLEDIIPIYVTLDRPNASGWRSCLHVGCDHGRKGNRAAFLFENDTVAFHCFNCGTKTVYDPNKHRSMPKAMVTVLNDFGVPEDEWKQVLLSNLAKRDTGKPTEQVKVININPTPTELPKHFYKLSEAAENDKWAIIAKDYLANSRGINPDSYPFYLSTGEGTTDAAKWKGRVIIPIYHRDNVIFWQGRSLTSRQRKYLSPPIPSDNVLYGYDTILTHSNLPIYVVEGWFDAFVIDGVAVFGNQLTDAQIKWLNRSKRQKVIIPDKFGDGHIMAEQALDMGWAVSTPDISNCKDVSAAVKRFGKLYVMQSIVEQTKTGFAAKTAIGIYCKHGQDESKTKNKKSHSHKGRTLRL